MKPALLIERWFWAGTVPEPRELIGGPGLCLLREILKEVRLDGQSAWPHIVHDIKQHRRVDEIRSDEVAVLKNMLVIQIDDIPT
jgi:hypothetical protein